MYIFILHFCLKYHRVPFKIPAWADKCVSEKIIIILFDTDCICPGLYWLIGGYSFSPGKTSFFPALELKKCLIMFFLVTIPIK